MLGFAEGQTVKLMDYEDYEEVGRENFQRYLYQARAKVTHYQGLAARHPEGSRSYRRNQQRVNAFQTRVDDFQQRLSDATRYLWRIEIHNYGDFFWVGNAVSAEGRRYTKSRWEGEPGRVKKLREALLEESNGLAPRPEEAAA